ncbi:MAG: hypothetical protein ACI84C_002323 [Flavobacteriales bacterium]|jgi:hypothetical protein
MKLIIAHQEQYSRGELLVRSFFGVFYIAIPHTFILFFLQIAAGFLQFLSFWAILFTGKYPESWFKFQEQVLHWRIRLNASLLNLVDGYPPFGLDAQMPGIEFEVPYIENSNRVSVLLRAVFGAFYVVLPHMFILMFRMLATYFLLFVAWWAVLFTGKYPKGMHDFNVGTLRWIMRVGVYLMYMDDNYPPFSGAE